MSSVDVEKMVFNRVVLVGIGLLGGSLARDLRAHKYLIVLATPMQVMVPLLASIEGLIPPQAILTDVGSVKIDLYTQLKEKTPKLLSQFVLAHPIAGGENSGVNASKRKLFNNKHVIITDTAEVSDAATSKVAQMWSALGANVLNMSLQEHDATFAKTSHLPHVIAFSLVNFLSDQADRERLFELAAAGFYDFTRIASSDAEMWRDICITEQAKRARDIGLLNKAESAKIKNENND